MDERLLKQIPLTLFGNNGPVWDEKSKERVRNIAQRLRDQEWAHKETEDYEDRMLSEYNRLLMEFNEALYRQLKEFEEGLQILQRRWAPTE